MVNVNPGPKPFLENRKVPVIDTERKLFGTRDEFLRLGAKEFTQKVYRSDKLYVTDTTMRDGQQSLLATRMRTKEVAGAANSYFVFNYFVLLFGLSLKGQMKKIFSSK